VPPKIYSRYEFCEGVYDDLSVEHPNLRLTDREPYRFKPFSDSVKYVVKEGDTLFALAFRYYSRHEDAAWLWWVIGDFQPDPIVDPTLLLTPGRVLYIPSERVLAEQILAESRKREVQEDFL
jgi:hypothetical protein